MSKSVERFSRPAVDGDLLPFSLLEDFGGFIPSNAITQLNQIGVHLTAGDIHALWMSLKEFEDGHYVGATSERHAMVNRAAELANELSQIIKKLPTNRGRFCVWGYTLDDEEEERVSSNLDVESMSEEELLEGIEGLNASEEQLELDDENGSVFDYVNVSIDKYEEQHHPENYGIQLLEYVNKSDLLDSLSVFEEACEGLSRLLPVLQNDTPKLGGNHGSRVRFLYWMLLMAFWKEYLKRNVGTSNSEKKGSYGPLVSFIQILSSARLIRREYSGGAVRQFIRRHRGRIDEFHLFLSRALLLRARYIHRTLNANKNL